MLANLISSAEVEISVELGTSHSTTQKQKAALSVSLGWGLIWHDMAFIKLQGAYPKTSSGLGVRRLGKIRKYLYRSWSAIGPIGFVWGVDLEWFGFWLGHAHCIWLAWFQRNQCCNSQQIGDRGGHYVAILSNTCLCLLHCWPKGTCKTVSHTNSNNAFWSTYGCISQSTAHVFISINEHQLWQGRGSCILSPLKVLQVFGPSWSGGAFVQSATMEGPIIAEFSSLNALNYKAGPRGSKL